MVTSISAKDLDFFFFFFFFYWILEILRSRYYLGINIGKFVRVGVMYRDDFLK